MVGGWGEKGSTMSHVSQDFYPYPPTPTLIHLQRPKQPFPLLTRGRRLALCARDGELDGAFLRQSGEHRATGHHPTRLIRLGLERPTVGHAYESVARFDRVALFYLRTTFRTAIP